MGDPRSVTPDPGRTDERAALTGRRVRAGVKPVLARLGMRILAIETSSPRGSVALADHNGEVVALHTEEPNAHAERLLPLIEQALARAGWNRRSLDRCALGVGPGSFTSLRVGIALGLGIAEGLGIPVVGVPSLRAMAAAAPPELGVVCPTLDARRGELFVAAYGADGQELLPATAIPCDQVVARLRDHLGQNWTLLGAASELAEGTAARHRCVKSELPHAAAVARLGLILDPGGAEALYVRNQVAIKPRMPPNPLLDARR